MKEYLEGTAQDWIEAERKVNWIYKRLIKKYGKELDIDQDNRYLINNKQLTGK